MKVAVCVLTFNTFKTGRDCMFRDCLESVFHAGFPFRLFLHDGGSDDRTGDIVTSLGGTVNGDEDKTIGHTMNQVIEQAMEWDPNLVVFSGDDYLYRTNWLVRLIDFMLGAPIDIGLVSCHVEPDYSWNTVTDVVDVGDERALIRETIPGASTVFWANQWPSIGPYPRQTSGEDYAVLQKLKAQGYRFAALDLAEDLGFKKSAWGNMSWTVAKPIDKKKWEL